MISVVLLSPEFLIGYRPHILYYPENETSVADLIDEINLR